MKVVLTVEEGPHAGESFTFEEHDNFIVGRASTAHFRLPKKDRYFSRVHFMIEMNPPCCRLMDMDSRNGTFVNDKKVKTVDLKDGDVIRGGHTVFKVRVEGAVVSSATQTIPPHLLPGSSAVRDQQAGSGDRAAAAEPPPQVLAAERLQRGAHGDDPEQPARGGPATPSADVDRSLLPDDYKERIAKQPQFIPGYSLVKELGRGGMGVVYQAIREECGSVVAVKAIKPAVVPKANDLERFLREANVLRELDHANIVSFRETGVVDGQQPGTNDQLLFIAMDYVPGTDAARMMAKADGLYPIPSAVGIVCQLLKALEYAHENGFVHRDIKPGNLLLTNVGGRGVVKLADFGLAKTYQSSSISGLTMMGEVGGTTPFMPPEQITNYRDAKPPVDQFAAAATLYYLIAKEPIHDFPRDISKQLLMILQQDAVHIQYRRPDVPDDLSDVIHKALNRDPKKRYADVAEFRQTLLPFCKPR